MKIKTFKEFLLEKTKGSSQEDSVNFPLKTKFRIGDRVILNYSEQTMSDIQSIKNKPGKIIRFEKLLLTDPIRAIVKNHKGEEISVSEEDLKKA